MHVENQVASFIDKFTPPMQTLIRECRALLQKTYPTAVQLVYDNYNFFVIRFGPSTRASDSIIFLAAQTSGINLCLLQHGRDLPDPTGILRGSGKVVRNIRLNTAEDLDRPDVTAVLAAQLAVARVPTDDSDGRFVIVKSVADKQRPRR